ncbi:type VI secretion protein, partial [Escherichia coli]|nr:type VI secretion protein [Escherichia coli]
MNFLHGPAKGLFFLSETGLTSLEFEGRKLLVHKSFIDLINTIVKPDDLLKLPLGQNVREKDEIFSIQSKLESLTTQLNAIQIVPYTVEVSSGPATISKGAKIIPIGTRLKLHCGSDTQVLDSLNFAESASFTWKAGQCQNVSIDVKFPSFIARYTLIGDTAWTDFLELFSDGEAE